MHASAFRLGAVVIVALVAPIAACMSGDGPTEVQLSPEILAANTVPVADAGPAVDSTEGSSFTFSGAASSDPDGDALTYRWDFGDGSPVDSGEQVTHEQVTHTYADNGSYTVTLTVSDGTDASTATTSATVRNVAPVVSLVLGSDPAVAGRPYVVSVSFVDPGADAPWKAEVHYGDGSVERLELSGKEFSLSHVYTIPPNMYLISVIVTDDEGAVGLDHDFVLVVPGSNQAPVANAGAATVAGEEGDTVRFDGSGSSDPDDDVLTYVWAFGDGTSDTGSTAEHVYADNGTYTVRLTVSDGTLSAAAALTAVIDNVAPMVGAFDGAELLLGQVYSAGGSFADPGDDTWTATVDYGDDSGVQSLGLLEKTFGLRHTYREAGTFTVTVRVKDDDGGVGVTQDEVRVLSSNRAPVADAGAATVAEREGSPVRFDGSGSSDPDGDALTYTWNFGDGATAAGPTAEHAYADNGTYTVRLTVSDGTLSATAELSAVIDNVAPMVEVFDGAELLLGQVYSAGGSFTDPGADDWSATVDYGDGSGEVALPLVGKTFTLSHAYAAAGTFGVTVTVSDDDEGVGVGHATVVVQSPEPPNRPPVATPGGPYIGVEGSVVGFDAGGSSDPDGDAISFAWAFGDGASATTGVAPEHTYMDDGTFTVTLIVIDARGLVATATTTATIANVVPAVDPIPGATLLPAETFTAGGSFADPGADDWSATVDYGDGSGVAALPLVEKTFSLSHVYAAAGTFSVTVTVSDGDGGVGVGQATVVVHSLQDLVGEIDQGVEGLQQSGVLIPPTANSLTASLDGAIANLNAGNLDGAIKSLDVFIKKVEGLVKTGRLTAQQAAPLLEEARRLQRIIRALLPG